MKEASLNRHGFYRSLIVGQVLAIAVLTGCGAQGSNVEVAAPTTIPPSVTSGAPSRGGPVTLREVARLDDQHAIPPFALAADPSGGVFSGAGQQSPPTSTTSHLRENSTSGRCCSELIMPFRWHQEGWPQPRRQSGLRSTSSSSGLLTVQSRRSTSLRHVRTSPRRSTDLSKHFQFVVWPRQTHLSFSHSRTAPIWCSTTRERVHFSLSHSLNRRALVTWPCSRMAPLALRLPTTPVRLQPVLACCHLVRVRCE